MVRILLMMAVALTLTTSRISQAQTTEKRSINLAGARFVIETIKGRAAELNSPGGTIAVVDDGGNLLAVKRMDGTFAASGPVSIGKARTAALFKKPTKVFEELINKGRTTMVTLNDFTPLQGGIPLLIDGQIVGAVGVSGAANADQDEELAMAGATAFQAIPPMPVKINDPVKKMEGEKDSFTLFGHEQVADGFAKGIPLLENEQYKVHASRRTEPGMAEVHDRETDIVYVVSGSATLVTGGTLENPKSTATGETRGTAIIDGDAHQLGPGDVFIVPQGMPHWFQKVDGPFLYFVVKPISSGGETK